MPPGLVLPGPVLPAVRRRGVLVGGVDGDAVAGVEADGGAGPGGQGQGGLQQREVGDGVLVGVRDAEDHGDVVVGVVVGVHRGLHAGRGGEVVVADAEVGGGGQGGVVDVVGVAHAVAVAVEADDGPGGGD